MKVPKHHPQSNLPVGTRIRYTHGKGLMTGHIAHPQQPDGKYEVRPLHGFRIDLVKPERIKFLEFIPGAPQPLPYASQWRGAPTETGRSYPEGNPNLQPIPKAPEPMLRDSDVILEIARGHFDSILDFMAEEIHARRKLLQNYKRASTLAKLKVGDRVRICGKIRPAYMVGIEGVVKSLGSTRVDVTFDSPLPRFGSGAKVPATCVEKI